MKRHMVEWAILAFTAQVLAAPALLAQDAAAPDSTALAAAKTAEQREVQDIRENGVGARFVISEIAPDPGPACAATIADRGGGIWAMQMELPGDEVPVRNFQPFIWGNGSVHRFAGEVTFDDAKMPVIVGEGDAANRLTFLLLEGTGYVYVRGTGRVVSPDGRAVQLGTPH